MRGVHGYEGIYSIFLSAFFGTHEHIHFKADEGFDICDVQIFKYDNIDKYSNSEIRYVTHFFCSINTIQISVQRCLNKMFMVKE